jgi:hypothetical protein
MDVETLDVFYAENILTHNFKPPTSYNCTPSGCVEAVDGDFATYQDCVSSGCDQA